MPPRCTLLSTLIPVRYEKELNTIEDLDNSGLGLAIPGGTVLVWLAKTDPRPAMNNIWGRSQHEIFPYAGKEDPEETKR